MEEENEIFELNPTSSTDDQNKQDKSATPNINPKLNCNEPAESLWRYFQRPISSTQTKIRCRICSNDYSRGSDQSTSSLRKHLETVHTKEYKQYIDAVAEAKLKKKENQTKQLAPKKLSKLPPGQSTIQSSFQVYFT